MFRKGLYSISDVLETISQDSGSQQYTGCRYKFQCLLQAIVPKFRVIDQQQRITTWTPELTGSLPETRDTQLKNRFGSEDYLVEIYVRDLLSIVMNNAISGLSTTVLLVLYDEFKPKNKLRID
ncbi:hypothetical protein NPIL_349291 [Nephila pilipes]|uniref:Uncharacterized protein n=1 Tax=Nephila pilipes TaxID=299642 RepID=A0A8X6UVF6_NEPPI|nr:hypothetical protein NPIL_349291 [Nephila pilipes]